MALPEDLVLVPQLWGKLRDSVSTFGRVERFYQNKRTIAERSIGFRVFGFRNGFLVDQKITFEGFEPRVKLK